MASNPVDRGRWDSRGCSHSGKISRRYIVAADAARNNEAYSGFRKRISTVPARGRYRRASIGFRKQRAEIAAHVNTNPGATSAVIASVDTSRPLSRAMTASEQRPIKTERASAIPQRSRLIERRWFLLRHDWHIGTMRRTKSTPPLRLKNDTEARTGCPSSAGPRQPEHRLGKTSRLSRVQIQPLGFSDTSSRVTFSAGAFPADTVVRCSGPSRRPSLRKSVAKS